MKKLHHLTTSVLAMTAAATLCIALTGCPAAKTDTDASAGTTGATGGAQGAPSPIPTPPPEVLQHNIESGNAQNKAADEASKKYEEWKKANPGK